MSRFAPDNAGLARPSSRWTRLGGRFVAALVAVFLLAAPYIANLFEESTRLFYMWRRGDAVAVIAAILLVAAGCAAAGEVVQRLSRPRWANVFNHAFVAALGAGVFANLCFYSRRDHGWHLGQFSMETQTLWLLLIGLIGYSTARGGTWLIHRARQLCVVIVPGVVIVFVQLLRLPTYPREMDSLAPLPVAATLTGGPAKASEAFPIYLFVFDEWSYERTFEAGRPREGLLNLTHLCDRSMVYHDAHSPADETIRSMPGLLLQTSLPIAWSDGTMGFKQDGRLLAPGNLPTVFDSAGDLIRSRVVIEWGPPSHLWLDGRVDIVRSYLWYPLGENPPSRMAAQAFAATYYWTDPWFPWLHAKLKTRLQDNHLLDIHEAIRQDVFQVIRAQPTATFAIFHLPLPHHPYIVDADGNYRGANPQGWDKSNLEGYQRNLARLDRLLGEFTATMVSAGRYEDAMIILTSDHSWRDDPARRPGQDPDSLTHVPLIVKLPGQTRPIETTERFGTWRVGELIRMAASGRRSERFAIDATTRNDLQITPDIHDIHGESEYVQ